MTKEDAIKAMDELSGNDLAAHTRADEILLEYLTTHDAEDLTRAFIIARNRICSWYP
jgi:hypothetical protein